MEKKIPRMGWHVIFGTAFFSFVGAVAGYLYAPHSVLFWLWAVPSAVIVLHRVDAFFNGFTVILNSESEYGGAGDQVMGDGLYAMVLAAYIAVSLVICFGRLIYTWLS